MTLWIDPMAVGEEAVVAAARRVLERGGVVAFPTETFYGLGVRAEDPLAIVRLVGLKQRVEGKPIPLIAASAMAARRIGAIPPALLPLAAAFWPGPLTLALMPEGSWPAPLIGPARDIGVRVPGHALARMLAAAAGGLITATSANRAGMPPAASSAQLDPGLAEELQLVIVGTCRGGSPSTVVGLDAAGRVELRRAGAVAAPELERVLGRPLGEA